MTFDLRPFDCTTEMLKIENRSVDVVVTSPPYNLGVKYGSYKDTESRDAYLAWCNIWICQVYSLLKDNGSFFLNLGSSPANPMLPFELIYHTAKIFRLQNTFHWIKSITVETRKERTVSVGHFKPINSKRFVTDCHEYVFHLTKHCDVELDRLSVGVPYADKSNLKRWAHTGGKDNRCRGNNWYIPYDTIQSRKGQRPHPATFPVELARRCIKIHGGIYTTVFDPFVGIGSSALAAKSLPEIVDRFIGFDIDPNYITETQKRLCLPNT